jgi:multidrug resistance protein, MATE family
MKTENIKEGPITGNNSLSLTYIPLPEPVQQGESAATQNNTLEQTQDITENNAVTISAPLPAVVSSPEANLSIKTTIKLLLNKGWPLVLARLATVGANYVTVLIVGRVGPDYLAASSLITSGQLLTVSTAACVHFSMAISAGKKTGEGKKQEIGSFLQSSLFLSAALSGVVISVTSFAEPLFKLIGVEPTLAQIAQEYFSAFAWGVPAFLAFNVWQQFFTGIREPKLVLYSTMANTVLLGGAGYLLVFGAPGIPKLDMAGSSRLSYLY